MRFVFFLFCLFLPFGSWAQGVQVATRRPPAAPTKPEDLASIEGRIVDVTTGDPVRKANLTLRKADFNPSTSSAPTVYTSSSDANGAFSMKELEPGRYRLSVSRTGYANTDYGASAPGRQGTMISLDKGQRLAKLDLKLVPHGVVYGRILDADGDPLAQAQVQVMTYRYNNGKRQLSPMNVGSTNDLGEYRIYGLNPGRYYLSATYRGNFADTIDRSGTPDLEYTTTYYPGSPDVASAAEISLSPGGQVRADMTLVKTRTVRISGKVTNLAVPEGPISIMLLPRGPIAVALALRQAPVTQGGKFDVRGIVPGAYYLNATTNFAGKTYAARVPVDVGSGNIENLSLTITAGADVQGRVQIEGNRPPPARLQLALRPREPGSVVFGNSLTTIAEDGTFTLKSVAPDSYSFQFSGLPDGYFIKSVRTGDTDVLARGLDLTNGAPGMVEIALSPNAAKASGVVRDAKGEQPVAGALVVLIPQEPERAGDQTYYKTASTDQTGGYTLSSIVPGNYKAYAWTDLEPGAHMDPEFVRPFASKGETVTIRESGQATIDLKVLASQ